MESHSPGYTSDGPPVSIRRRKSRFCLRLGLAAILIAAPLELRATGAEPSPVAAVVARYGLRPLDPAVPSPAFELPDLGGGERSLADFAGRWVVLTFWATWCGPCRWEMPSLERLHQNRQAAGLSVVGVSVDRTAGPAERFVADYGLSFPNLWDSRGRAAAAYRAESIPLSYLVDPAGRVAAVSLGARDWSALQPMVDELLELAPPGQSAAAGYATSAGPIELPSTLQPPTAEVQASAARPEVGEAFSVEVRVRWAGHFEDYLPHPPRVHLPEGVEQAAVTASTRSSDGRNVVVYRIDLEAREAGAFALDPIELSYTPRAESEPIVARIEGPTVTVVEATTLGLRPAAWLAGGAGAAALGLALFGLGRWRRARLPVAEAAGPGLGDELSRRLDAARARRLEGDLRGAALLLAEIDRQLGIEGESERAALDRLIEGARYGGRAPSREELDGMERRVGRRVRELAADPKQAAREALRLRNQES